MGALFWVCRGLFFCVGLWFGFCLVVVVVVAFGSFLYCWKIFLASHPLKDFVIIEFQTYESTMELRMQTNVLVK